MEAGKLLKKGLTRIIPGQSHLNVIGTGSQPNSGSVELLFCLSGKNRRKVKPRRYPEASFRL